MGRVYLRMNVLYAARQRIRTIFDMFPNIRVQVSGGKDSSVLLHLCWQEAVKRNRIIDAAFIDQEAEYSSTIDNIRYISTLSNIRFHWYQVPFKMTNSTSMLEGYLNCWDGKNIRNFEAKSIRSLGNIDTSNLTWEQLLPAIGNSIEGRTAQFIGLRSSESLNRYRAVTKHPAIDGINWSSKTTNPDLINVYPIYDWAFEDIWRFIHDEKIPYNKVYDFQFMRNYNKREMRVSCLIHEKAYHCLADLAAFEPETFKWLCSRVSGIETAARYAKERTMYSNELLPDHYPTWLSFRQFLLDNHPNKKQRDRFVKRFQSQPENEDTYKQQVGQLLINDWENITTVDLGKEAKRIEKRNKWIDAI